MADVFLSYARASVDDAMRIAECLRAAGYSVWYDESLPAHRAYTDVITEQLDAASAVLVLWTKEAAASHWVRSEANRARETGRLVQLRLDDSRLPMPFDQIQCADLRRWGGDCDTPGWRTAARSIVALTGEERPPKAPIARIGADRRTILAAGGAAALVGAGGFAVWRYRQPEMSPEAKLLLQKGMDALQQNDALDPQELGTTAQAIALLTEAAQAAPESATAWGALAMAYAVRRRAISPPERPGLEERSRSAAKVALELDSNEHRALAAQRMLDPEYRNWLAAERADREALSKNPRLPILLFILSDLLGSVGRWRDATELSKRFDRKKFLIPGADRKVIINLWASGDLHGADEAVEAAVQSWPQHPQIWRTRFAYLMYTGRPVEALALLREGTERPIELSAEFIDAIRATAEALAGQRDAASAIKQDLDYLDSNPKVALQVAQACVALGAQDQAFALLDGYYFGEGEWSRLAPAGGDQDRLTSPLFQPPMRRVWQDPRFDRLLDRIGLTTYWRQSGTVPDFRRLA